MPLKLFLLYSYLLLSPAANFPKLRQWALRSGPFFKSHESLTDGSPFGLQLFFYETTCSAHTAPQCVSLSEAKSIPPQQFLPFLFKHVMQSPGFSRPTLFQYLFFIVVLAKTVIRLPVVFSCCFHSRCVFSFTFFSPQALMEYHLQFPYPPETIVFFYPIFPPPSFK